MMDRTREWVSSEEAAWICVGLYVWRHFVEDVCEEGMLGQGGWCKSAERLQHVMRRREVVCLSVWLAGCLSVCVYGCV